MQHADINAKIRELTDESDTRYAELQLRCERNERLLRELVFVAYTDYMCSYRRYAREDPPGYEATANQRVAGEAPVALAAGHPVPPAMEAVQQTVGIARIPRLAGRRGSPMTQAPRA